MPGFSFFIVFGLFFMLFPCEGTITSPPDGTSYSFLPGTTNGITWTFDDDAKASVLVWYFNSSKSSKENLLAFIVSDGKPQKMGILPRLNITKPSDKARTVFLINVDEGYDGTYKLLIKKSKSVVRVFIAKKPMVIVCPSPLIINEDGDGSCLCKSVGGSPPATVAWYDKNNKPIGGKRIGENTLNLTDVDETDSGSYKCVAESYSDDSYRAEKLIGVNVRLNFKPKNTKISFSNNPSVGDSVTISCESDGLPEPIYVIFHNGSEVRNERTYTIDIVEYTFAGVYQCVAVNKLGIDLSSDYLTVQGKETKNMEVHTKTDITCSSDASRRTEWYIIVVTLVSGIIIGVLLSYIVFRSRREFVKRRGPQPSNPEPPRSQSDSTYQELDLKNMNKDENYQSLRGNTARNDGVNDVNSIYTDLSKTRDVENHYKSLT